MPRSTLYAFILSFLAGISTIIGSLIIFIDKKRSDRVVAYSLSFAAGVMLCVSIIDLLPNSYKLITWYNNLLYKLLLVLIFMVIGIILSITIDKYIPDYNNDSRGLYKIGIISMIAIIMHNVPEGVITFITSTSNLRLGIKLSISIALHNVPEGICIAMPIYHATNNKFKAIIYSLISGFSEILGSIIAYVFLSQYINNSIIGMLYAVIAGIMISISVYELIPTSYKKSSLKGVIIALIIGFVVMFISHILI